MRYKIYIEGNTFYIQDTDFADKLYEGHAKDVLLRRNNLIDTVIAFSNVNNWSNTRTLDFATEVDLIGADYTDFATFVTWCNQSLGKSSPQASGIVYVNQGNYLFVLSNIDETKEYFFEEPVTFEQSITLNETITIRSYGTAIPRIIAGGAFPLFTGDNAGNVFMYNIAIDNSFVGSTVFNLTGDTGFETFSLTDVNFVNSDGLGELNGYRQIFYSPVAYLGGKPSLTINGANFGGFKSTNFNAVNLSDSMTEPVFKAGDSLVFNSTFDLEGKIDLGSTAALFDFDENNFLNNENLIVNNTTVTRNGVQNDSDTTIYPNIDHTNVKSLWSNNTGLPDTSKGIKMRITSEIPTIIGALNTYYPLEGTFTPQNASHFDSPVNGQARLLSGNGRYSISGKITLDGNQNDKVDLRFTLSTNDGVTFPTQIEHTEETVNNLSGARDVAFIYFDFPVTLNAGDRIRAEIEDKTTTNALTGVLDSFYFIKS